VVPVEGVEARLLRRRWLSAKAIHAWNMAAMGGGVTVFRPSLARGSFYPILMDTGDRAYPEFDDAERERVGAWCDWPVAWAERHDPTANIAEVVGLDEPEPEPAPFWWGTAPRGSGVRSRNEHEPAQAAVTVSA
jgi:hypothetical protein